MGCLVDTFTHSQTEPTDINRQSAVNEKDVVKNFSDDASKANKTNTAQANPERAESQRSNSKALTIKLSFHGES